MTDKITIERETLEAAIAALTYHQNQTRPIESTRIALDTMRASLAAQPTVDDHLKCGHHRSLAINSAETGEFLYCDLCDAKSRCRDAEAMEAELRAALAAQPADNEWRTAIEDELICAHIGTADSFPDAKSALKNLIDWHVSVSLDPAVSSAAQALIDRGRAQPAEPVEPGTLTDSYVQQVPDKCDRIVWRNRYYSLPPAPAAVPLTDKQILDLDEPFGAFARTVLAADRRIAFARAVLAAAGGKP